MRDCTERARPGMAADCALSPISDASWQQRVDGGGELWIVTTWIKPDHPTCRVGVDDHHGAALRDAALQLIAGEELAAPTHSQTDGGEEWDWLYARSPHRPRLVIRRGQISRSDRDGNMQGFELNYFPAHADK